MSGARTALVLAGLGLLVGLARAGMRRAPAAAPAAPPEGTLTFSTPGAGAPFVPAIVQDYDLASGRLTVRFDGLDASRARTGETAYLTRLAPGWVADHGIVVADNLGIPGAPVFVCREYQFAVNASCGLPKLAPDRTRVAFMTAGGGGTACQTRRALSASRSVVVSDRVGRVLRRFDGYTDPDWLPDGRLLLLGTECRNGGVWVAGVADSGPARTDRGRVATPAAAAAVSPDGRAVAFVWNGQLWGMTLDGRGDLTQWTRFPQSVTAAAWSPDGRMVAVLLTDASTPARSVVLIRPGDDQSATTIPLTVYPYGPLSWR